MIRCRRRSCAPSSTATCFIARRAASRPPMSSSSPSIMDYVSHDPSVVRSIRQRVLLDAWLRARRRPRTLPALMDFDPETGADELADMMGFDVEGEDGAARFVITHEGTRLTATYGN